MENQKFLKVLAEYYKKFLETGFKKNNTKPKKHIRFRYKNNLQSVKLNKYINIRKEILKYIFNDKYLNNSILIKNTNDVQISKTIIDKLYDFTKNNKINIINSDNIDFLVKFFDDYFNKKINIKKIINYFEELIMQFSDKFILQLLQYFSQESDKLLFEKDVIKIELSEYLFSFFENKLKELIENFKYESANNESVNNLLNLLKQKLKLTKILEKFFIYYFESNLYSKIDNLDQGMAKTENNDTITVNFYLCDISEKDDKYPIFFILIKLNRKDNGYFTINYDDNDKNLYLNEIAINYIYNRLNPKENFILPAHLKNSISIDDNNFKVNCNELFSFIFSSFKMESEFDISSSKDRAKIVNSNYYDDIKISNSLYIHLLDLSEESLIEDFYKIMKEDKYETLFKATFLMTSLVVLLIIILKKISKNYLKIIGTACQLQKK